MKRADPEARPAGHRVRIGLTGLAFVFLLVLLAAAFFGLAGRDRGPSGKSDPALAASKQDTDTPKEPLAELGVTPGGAPDESPGNAAAPPARDRRR